MRTNRILKIALACSIVAIMGLSFWSFKVDQKNFEISKNLDIFYTLFRELNLFYVDEVEPEKLIKTGIDDMLVSLDPYTVYIPEQDIMGDAQGDLLVVSWGGTKGSVSSAVRAMQAEGKKVSHAHFNYIMPLPKNTEKVLDGFKKIVVCELNAGQFANYLRMKHPVHQYLQYNKMQGLPFTITELVEHFNNIL